MSKQTALQWLGYELNTSLFYDISPDMWEKVNKLFKQALQMEREQIVDAWNGGDYAYFYSKETGRDFVDGDEYYEERFGGQDE